MVAPATGLPVTLSVILPDILLFSSVFFAYKVELTQISIRTRISVYGVFKAVKKCLFKIVNIVSFEGDRNQWDYPA